MAELLIPVFDGHNDMLYQMLRRQNYDASYFYRPEGAELCINAEKAQAGGFSGGFCIVCGFTGRVNCDLLLRHRLHLLR